MQSQRKINWRWFENRSPMRICSKLLNFSLPLGTVLIFLFVVLWMHLAIVKFDMFKIVKYTFCCSCNSNTIYLLLLWEYLVQPVLDPLLISSRIPLRKNGLTIAFTSQDSTPTHAFGDGDPKGYSKLSGVAIPWYSLVESPSVAL